MNNLTELRAKAKELFTKNTKNLGLDDNARSTLLRELLILPKFRYVEIETLSASECRFVIKKYSGDKK